MKEFVLLQVLQLVLDNPNSGETRQLQDPDPPTIRVNGASSYEAQLKLQADGTVTDTQLIA